MHAGTPRAARSARPAYERDRCAATPAPGLFTKHSASTCTCLAASGSEGLPLLGNYRTPRARVGRFIRCLIRGEVAVVGFHDGPIPWPVCKKSRRHAIIVYGDLARAVRRESELAVCHRWGVGMDTVWKWRKALGVRATTRGTSRLRSEYAKEP